MGEINDLGSICLSLLFLGVAMISKAFVVSRLTLPLFILGRQYVHVAIYRIHILCYILYYIVCKKVVCQKGGQY